MDAQGVSGETADVPRAVQHAHHNSRCWSPDGRYLCYTRYGEGTTNDEVFVYDAQADTTRSLGRGLYSRWANTHNWLLFLRLSRQGAEGELYSEIIWAEMDLDRIRAIAREPGELDRLGETDADDQWLYGGRVLKSKQRVDGQVVGGTQRSAIRVRIADPGEVQDLPGVHGYQFMTNPRHPVFITRWRTGPGATSGRRACGMISMARTSALAFPSCRTRIPPGSATANIICWATDLPAGGAGTSRFPAMSTSGRG